MDPRTFREANSLPWRFSIKSKHLSLGADPCWPGLPIICTQDVHFLVLQMSERWQQRVFSRTMYPPPFGAFIFRLWNFSPQTVRLLTMLAICVLILVPSCVTLQNQTECHCEQRPKPSQRSSSSTQFQNNVKEGECQYVCVSIIGNRRYIQIES